MPIDREPMMLKDEKPESRFAIIPPAPAGVTNAVCVYVEDLGRHTQSWPGEPDKIVRKVMIGWELAHLIQVDDEEGQEPCKYNGEPYLLSKTYTWSLHEKSTLHRHLSAWRGKKISKAEAKLGIDLRLFIGTGATITVIHTTPREIGDRVYANIEALAPSMGGVPMLVPQLKELPKWVIERKREGGIIIADTLATASDADNIVPF